MEKFNCPSCKYEFVQDYIDGKKENDYVIVGEEKPIRLYMSNSIKIHRHGDRGLYSEDEQVALIGCPHCRTVILDC